MHVFMKYFLFIRSPLNENEFFYKGTKMKLIEEYIKQYYKDIKIILITPKDYIWITQESIILSEYMLPFTQIQGVVFWWSDGNEYTMPYILDALLYHNIPTNINNRSRILKSKINQSFLFSILWLPHPETAFINTIWEKQSVQDTIQQVTAHISWEKLIIKWPKSCNGESIYCVTKNNLSDNDQENIINILKESNGILLQEYIWWSEWRDIRSIIIQGRVQILYTRYNPNDFRSNITTGGSMKIADNTIISKILQSRIKQYAKQIYKYTKMPYFTLDFLFPDKKELIICEINPVGTYFSSYYKNTMEIFDPIVSNIMRNIYKL